MIEIKFEELIHCGYDSDIGKYVYMKCGYETEETKEKVRVISKESIPNDIYTIICSALIPKVKVTIDSNFVYIKTMLPNSDGGGYNLVTINKNTGIVEEFYSNTKESICKTTYYYEFDYADEYMIKEKYLEDMEYVIEENVYE